MQSVTSVCPEDTVCKTIATLSTVVELKILLEFGNRNRSTESSSDTEVLWVVHRVVNRSVADVFWSSAFVTAV